MPQFNSENGKLGHYPALPRIHSDVGAVALETICEKV